MDDSDARDVIVSQSTLTLPEGSDDTYTVKLATQPVATTTVSVAVAGDAQLTTNPSELTFTTSSWNTPQTITLTATQDDDASDNTATLTHVASGSDYVSVTRTVSVTVTDDDVPQVTVMFGAGAYMVAEGDMVTVTVTLSADPERTVVIPLTHTPQGGATSADYSGVPQNVTFNTGDMSQTITFMAAQDTDNDDGESVLLAFGILPDGVNPGTRNETTVSITDDDVPQVTVSFGQAAYTVAEGGTQSVTVTLSADPERTVVIPITHTPRTGRTPPPTTQACRRA